MKQPPSPLKCLRYPVTTCVTVLSITATLVWWWSGEESLGQFGNGNVLHEPWRLFTPVLFHAHVVHLLFNICWFWAFGSIVEDVFGWLRTLGIFAILAAGSTAAEWAMFQGGIGLSGVVYGLFGLLWVLSRGDIRFEDAVDRNVVELMFGWFCLCIVFTMAGMWNIATVAHAAGCALGVLLGWTICSQNRGERLRRATILAAVFILFFEGATIARPYVNLPSDAAETSARRAAMALDAGDYDRAIELYQRAVESNPRMYNWWKGLAAAYRQAGQIEKAKAAEEKAVKLEFQRPSTK